LKVTAQAIVQSVVGVTIYSVPLLANQLAEVLTLDLQELPLLPDSAYTCWSNALNQGLAGNLWWRERFLEDSERT
jgi:hypothetical protein